MMMNDDNKGDESDDSKPRDYGIGQRGAASEHVVVAQNHMHICWSGRSQHRYLQAFYSQLCYPANNHALSALQP